MHGVIKKFQPDFTYGQQKDLNFAKIYAAGQIKMALMLRFILKDEAERFRREKLWDHPKLDKTKEINRIYNRECPEVPILLKKASDLAKNRGYVKTITGQRLHKALNGRIQGSAADIMKQKLVELHSARRDTGLVMRYTVHDEVDGDTTGSECTKKVHEILNRQSFPDLLVPILWEVSTGPNWGQVA
jgi:DNA polymerase I-like protein with 3'-5' exonuclease and polymerase domains